MIKQHKSWNKFYFGFHISVGGCLCSPLAQNNIYIGGGARNFPRPSVKLKRCCLAAHKFATTASPPPACSDPDTSPPAPTRTHHCLLRPQRAPEGEGGEEEPPPPPEEPFPRLCSNSSTATVAHSTRHRSPRRYHTAISPALPRSGR